MGIPYIEYKQSGETVLECTLPKWARNVDVTLDGWLIADSNISACWATVKIKLPHPAWRVRSVKENNELGVSTAFLTLDKDKYNKMKIGEYINKL